MRVKFVGKASLGYQPGRVYDLRLVANGLGHKPMITYPIPCPYGSWDAFWANWEKVQQ